MPIGADLSKDSGLILAHHAAEGILNNLSDVAISFMCPTAFYYNLLGFLNVIKNMGNIVSNYGGEDISPWVSPIDIAAAIAEEITKPLESGVKRVVHLSSNLKQFNFQNI